MAEVSVAPPPVAEDEAAKLASVQERLQPYIQPEGPEAASADAGDADTPIEMQQQDPEQSFLFPENVEMTQDKIDRIHQTEARNVSLRILENNSNKPEDFKPETLGQLVKYNNILELASFNNDDDQKDPKTKYKHTNSDGSTKTYDYIPLNWGSNGPYVIEKNGVYMPSDFKIDGSVQVVMIKEKHGRMLTCEDANGNSIKIDLDFLADAQAHAILRANQKEDTLPHREAAVLEAYDEFAQTGKDEKIQQLYTGDASIIKESAQNNGLITADSVRTYLDKIYAPIEPKPGEKLTPDQELHNEKFREKKAQIILKLNLDARVVADTEVMVGVVTQTMEATLDNLTLAINSETDPEIRKLYEDTLTTLSNPDNQKKLPDVMTQVMENLSPDFAMAMNKSLETGDVKGLYKELIKKFPAAEKLKEFDSKITDKILVGGLGIMAILAALLGTVAAAGMKPAR